MPNTTIITISQKIVDELEKKRLTDIAKKYLPDNIKDKKYFIPKDWEVI